MPVFGTRKESLVVDSQIYERPSLRSRSNRTQRYHPIFHKPIPVINVEELEAIDKQIDRQLKRLDKLNDNNDQKYKDQSGDDMYRIVNVE